MFHTSNFDEPSVSGILVMINKPAKGSDLPLPRRMRILREALGYEYANHFAEAIDQKPAAYGMVEAGTGGLSTKMFLAINKLCPDIQWEWIRSGDDRFLPAYMRKRLRVAEVQLVSQGKIKAGGTKDKTLPVRPRPSSA
jgi:hypothetical protein